MLVGQVALDEIQGTYFRNLSGMVDEYLQKAFGHSAGHRFCVGRRLCGESLFILQRNTCLRLTSYLDRSISSQPGLERLFFFLISSVISLSLSIPFNQVSSTSNHGRVKRHPRRQPRCTRRPTDGHSSVSRERPQDGTNDDWNVRHGRPRSSQQAK